MGIIIVIIIIIIIIIIIVRTQNVTIPNDMGFARKKALAIKFIECGFEGLGLDHWAVVSHGVSDSSAFSKTFPPAWPMRLRSFGLVRWVSFSHNSPLFRTQGGGRRFVPLSSLAHEPLYYIALLG